MPGFSFREGNDFMEWITDRYPEIGQKCIVTIRMRNFNNQLVNLLTTATYRRNGFVTVNACGRVLAWIPAPEPYENESGVYNYL